MEKIILYICIVLYLALDFILDDIEKDKTWIAFKVIKVIAMAVIFGYILAYL